MENSEGNPFSLNLTGLNVSQPKCFRTPNYLWCVSCLDVVAVLLGQPMWTKMLWLSLTSRTADVLNCNLALYHIFLYLFYYAHLGAVLALNSVQGALQSFIFTCFQIGCPMHLSFVCLERYIAVIHPTYFPLLKRHRCREIAAALVWITSVPFAVVSAIEESFESVATLSIADYLPVWFMSSLIYIMVYTSYKVARALQNSPVGKDALHPAKKRAFITICVTLATSLTCYIPVIGLQKFMRNSRQFECVIVPVCIFFLSLATFVHPLIYFFAKGEFSCSRRNNKVC